MIDRERLERLRALWAKDVAPPWLTVDRRFALALADALADAERERDEARAMAERMRSRVTQWDNARRTMTAQEAAAVDRLPAAEREQVVARASEAWRAVRDEARTWNVRATEAEEVAERLRAEYAEARAELARRQRAGQAVFNTLYEIDPFFAESIRGGDLDPFHDDSRIASALAAWRSKLLARGGSE